MKKAIQELKEAPVKKKEKDISHIQCFRCRNMGHYANMCPELKETLMMKKIKDLSQIECYRCRNMGHYRDMCPELEGKEKL